MTTTTTSQSATATPGVMTLEAATTEWPFEQGLQGAFTYLL